MPHIQRLRDSGDRATPVRSELIAILSKAGCPLSVVDLGRRLSEINLRPNKTTLYRALDLMVARGWIHELDFGGGRKCYEWAEVHHHHLVCKKCHRIEELEAHDLESAFEQFEKKLSLRSSFADLSHSLEFYGVCGQCQ